MNIFRRIFSNRATIIIQVYVDFLRTNEHLNFTNIRWRKCLNIEHLYTINSSWGQGFEFDMNGDVFSFVSEFMEMMTGD